MRTVLWVIATSFLMQLKERLADTWFYMSLVILPIMLSSLAILLFEYSGQENYFLFGVVGSGLIGIWNTNLWSSGFIVASERWRGTLELLLAAPTSFEVVLFGRSLANAVISVVSLLVSFGSAILLFRVPVRVAQPLAFVGGLLLTILAITCLGLMLGSLFVLSRAAIGAANVLNYPVYILSGLFFPLTLLPVWIRPLSYTLATTWGNMALYEAVTTREQVVMEYLALLGLAAVYYLVAHQLYRIVEARVRQSGGLELH